MRDNALEHLPAQCDFGGKLTLAGTPKRFRFGASAGVNQCSGKNNSPSTQVHTLPL